MIEGSVGMLPTLRTICLKTLLHFIHSSMSFCLIHNKLEVEVYNTLQLSLFKLYLL